MNVMIVKYLEYWKCITWYQGSAAARSQI